MRLAKVVMLPALSTLAVVLGVDSACRDDAAVCVTFDEALP